MQMSKLPESNTFKGIRDGERKSDTVESTLQLPFPQISETTSEFNEVLTDLIIRKSEVIKNKAYRSCFCNKTHTVLERNLTSTKCYENII